MNHPSDLHYSEDHEWLRLEGTTGTIGITDFAQAELTDIVAVDLPEIGTEVKAGEPFGAIEAIKAYSDLFSPVSGKITATNEEILDSPELVNEDPYGKGWMVKIELSAPGEVDDLLKDVPEEIREDSKLTIGPALAEDRVSRLMATMAGDTADLICFAGAGIYDHVTPAAVDAILSRSEFYTAYTPYQAEVSQGTLQAIYEFPDDGL